MDILTQVDRLMVLDTTLDPDTLLIRSFSGSEGISRLFRFDIEMVADRTKAGSITPEDLIGQKMSMHLSLTTDYLAGERRHFNGIVNRFWNRFAPGKRTMAGDKDGGTGERIPFGKSLGNHMASVGLIIRFNFTGGE